MDNINPYDILGIHKNFTIEELKDKYKRVAKKTHPDKGGDSDEFKKANEANRNKDLGALMEMADDLGIEVPIDDELAQEMKKQTNAIIETIQNLKTTMAWTWVHTPHDNRTNLKKYILEML